MAETRARIQRCALELFALNGFEKTTVAEIAAQADVAPMTVFRHFATKEDIVLSDDFDEELVSRISETSPSQKAITRIAIVLLGSLSAASKADLRAMFVRLDLASRTPALRSRRWENIHLTQKAIVEGLGGIDDAARFQISVAANACLTALSTALFHWAAGGGASDPVPLARRALEMIGAELED